MNKGKVLEGKFALGFNTAKGQPQWQCKVHHDSTTIEYIVVSHNGDELPATGPGHFRFRVEGPLAEVSGGRVRKIAVHVVEILPRKQLRLESSVSPSV